MGASLEPESTVGSRVGIQHSSPCKILRHLDQFVVRNADFIGDYADSNIVVERLLGKVDG